MSVDEFFQLTATRIPTPTEFVEFAESQRWKFRVSESGAALLANKSDPLALAFARMLSREPYRTNVLKFLSERGHGEDRPVPAPVPVPVVEAAPELCSLCGRDVSDPEDRERLADPLYCQHFGVAKAVRDGHGVVHAESRRCPHKPKP